MPKIPRDISSRKLMKLLEKYGYQITRETASHIRLPYLITILSKLEL